MRILLIAFLSCFAVSSCNSSRTVVKDGVTYEERESGMWTAKKESSRATRQNSRGSRFLH